MAVDLPALERPAKATSGVKVAGRSRRWLTVVKNRDWCNRGMGTREKGRGGPGRRQRKLPLAPMVNGALLYNTAVFTRPARARKTQAR